MAAGLEQKVARKAVDMVDRGRFLKSAAYGVYTFLCAGAPTLLTCAEARAAQAKLTVLTPGEQLGIEALGETLLPGAREAGIAHYIDVQLSSRPEECLLLLRYLEFHQPYPAFYQKGLAALDASSRSVHGTSFAQLPEDRRAALVRTMSAGDPPGWDGVPAPLFYFATRSDAVDVVYGTVAGFERLGIPYMPHISPNAPW